MVLARVRNHLAAKRQSDLLSRQSLLDALTGLPNRRRLDGYLAETGRQAIATGESVGLLMIDVDHFKAYNDCYGHGVGDACLRQVADALRLAARQGGGLVGRCGGEEFLWVLPGADLVATGAAARTALESVRNLGITHGASTGGPVVTVSIGAWAGPLESSGQLDGCLAEADRQLYRAKSAGRDQFSV